MPSTLQNVMIGEELLSAMRLIKTGLRELNRMDGSTDFFHLPILLLASGFERMMKTACCCHHLETTGNYPDRRHFSKNPKRSGQPTHDLMWLLDKRVRQCFSDNYHAGLPAAQSDVEFLEKDKRMRRMVKILSDFAKSARYYNLNIVFGDANPGPSPEDEWKKLEMEVLREDPSWTRRIGDQKDGDSFHRQINTALTIQCEKLARALARLFTIGGLGAQAKQISPHTHHFLFLMDDQLGKTDYERIHI
ncbi:hypothetical protein [Ectothiorhodospira marina]|uniref:Uncharacterized protein n=1 Tax=Ectothiorhodospira marina TaxID=1396821 RepID=A0A1H7KXN9_9GAMM|nr:hypothetical protein [Ectothiorhodospira marina]SEK91334.1 hypothetical protein SAMN05444515_106143 [Ectothiorhodospira marina]